jgi:hypothetical protein
MRLQSAVHQIRPVWHTLMSHGEVQPVNFVGRRTNLLITPPLIHFRDT